MSGARTLAVLAVLGAAVATPSAALGQAISPQYQPPAVTAPEPPAPVAADAGAAAVPEPVAPPAAAVPEMNNSDIGETGGAVAPPDVKIPDPPAPPEPPAPPKVEVHVDAPVTNSVLVVRVNSPGDDGPVTQLVHVRAHVRRATRP